MEVMFGKQFPSFSSIVRVYPRFGRTFGAFPREARNWCRAVPAKEGQGARIHQRPIGSL